MAYDPNNIFARILRGELPSHRVYEDEHTVALMDLRPQAPGHTLVLPRAAAENIFELGPDELAAAARTAQKVAQAVKRAFNPPCALGATPLLSPSRAASTRLAARPEAKL